jgi:DNA replication and repair protein RecF
VAMERVSARNFRCLVEIEFEPDPKDNLIYGMNASGKTSILEAIAYLGRGRSFRGASTRELIRHGEEEFLLRGQIRLGDRVVQIGARNSARGLETRINGEPAGAAGLAGVLPLQVVDPDVHELVAGSPDRRRRYLDWLAFHVEPGYLERWRRFRRVLKQRNAALRDGAGRPAIGSWNSEFQGAALAVDASRRSALKAVLPALERAGEALLGGGLGYAYRSGWSADRELGEVLEEGLARDQQQGSTQAGPQRADLKLLYDDRQAKRLVSRGQQKLLACAMVLAASETVQARLGRRLLLLLDDPAAELDTGALARLMGCVSALDCQVIATSIAPDAAIFAGTPAVFHVEQGVLGPGAGGLGRAGKKGP